MYMLELALRELSALVRSTCLDCTFFSPFSWVLACGLVAPEFEYAWFESGLSDVFEDQRVFGIFCKCKGKQVDTVDDRFTIIIYTIQAYTYYNCLRLKYEYKYKVWKIQNVWTFSILPGAWGDGPPK